MTEHDQAPQTSSGIREQHIKTEATIRSVGILYYLGAVLLIFSAVTGFVIDTETILSLRILTAAILIALGIAQYITGTGLRSLSSWARIPAIILSCIGLLSIPIGTLINGYILCIIISQKGRMVFSEDYKRIISETPQIKYRTSKGTWILLGLLLAVLIIIVLMVLG